MPRILLLIFLCFPFFSHAQSDTVFLDSKLKQTTPKKAGHFKVSKKDGEVYSVTLYYMNGGKEMEGTYLSLDPEIKYGRFTYYDTKGLKISEGNYADNKKDGKWTFYFAGTDRVMKTNEYKNDHLDGVCILNDSLTGNRVNCRNYKEGLLDGKFTTYFVTTKKLRSTLEYRKGVMNGMVTHYDSATGYRWGVGSVVDDRREGEWIGFYPDSDDTLARFNYVKGRKHGQASFFYHSGNIVALGMYENGYKHDEWNYYYDKENTLRSTINFFRGWFDGEAKYFDSATGKLEESGKFIYGKRTEKWTSYYPETGKVEGVANYMNDKLEGDYEGWYPSGKPMLSGSFYRNTPVKTHLTHFEDGSIRSKQEYPGNIGYGTLVTYDSATRKVVVKGEQRDGKRVGMWYVYHPGTDQLSIKRKYKDGLGEGEYVSFYDDGSKEGLGSLRNGKKVGDWVYYHRGSGKEWLKLRYDNDGMLSGDIYAYYGDGKTKRHDLYDAGKLIESSCYSIYEEKIKATPLMTKAAFDGDVFTFIGNELKYPEVSRSQGVQGKVVVEFIVNEDGTLSDIEVSQSLNEECDKEAIRIVATMPKWKPTQFDDTNLKWPTSLPIVFWIPESTAD
jgi:TonB family protein